MNILQLRAAGHQIVDVFPFFNELELLEIRFEILSPYVDRFVLVESPVTYSGRPKPLWFEQNKSRFSKWSEKIIHHIISKPFDSAVKAKARVLSPDTPEDEREVLQMTLESPLTNGVLHWRREFHQRESIRCAIPKLHPHDIVFVGDLDEIWNPHLEVTWDDTVVFRLQQEVYAYWLNNQSSENWSSAIFTSYRNIKNQSLNELRANSAQLTTQLVPNGGWHFSYQGGSSRIEQKLESFGHTEYNTWRIKSRISRRLSQRRDILGRPISYRKCETGLPDSVLLRKSLMPDWFL